MIGLEKLQIYTISPKRILHAEFIMEIFDCSFKNFCSSIRIM